MVRIEFAPEVLDDVDRFIDHMAQHDVEDIPARIEEILQAIQVLSHSPLIGRPVKGGQRELIIGRGGKGYIALYRYLDEIETVFVLALRAQRESGFKH